ncbi:MAG: hypothetical protein WCD18_25520 [Thermosynechococcaceae cyanobacterium]
MPEVVAVVLTLLIGLEHWGESPSIWVILLLNTVLLRLIWNSALAIHGLGHVLAIATVDRTLSGLSLPNILENRTLASIFKSLLPFSTLFIPGLHSVDYPWVAAGDATPWAIRVKALGGLGLNLIAMGIAPMLFGNGLDPVLSYFGSNNPCVSQFLLQAFIGANGLLAFSSLSDLAAFFSGSADCFNCGNFGFVGKRPPTSGNELLPENIVDIFHTMGRETEIRGEQAGGGLVIARNKENQTIFVGKKVVNQKRENLTRSLETAFASVRQKATTAGIKPLESTVIGAWHYRYGTSGPPDVLETHWHEWMPARSELVWGVEEGKWVNRRKNVNHRITHNGDFDAWILFGKPVENAHLGLWLQRVLHTPNRAKGDSPKIAGMMDLLITQGMWVASVRLAYQLAVAESIEAAFDGHPISENAPDTAPSESELSRWAEIFEIIFLLLYGASSSEAEAISAKEKIIRFEKRVLQRMNQDASMRCWSQQRQIAFVKTAIQAFFRNDLFHATQQFMAKAKGSFGLVTVSTLDPERLVLSAQGQPIAIGFNPQDQYVVYASEPAAVDAVLANASGASRLDLDQTTGEIALVDTDRITVYSMEKERQLQPSDLAQRWISMEHNLYIQPTKVETKDPVESDIQAIPQVLQGIEQSWMEPFSLNCQSAEHLVYFLIKKAKYFRQKQIKGLEAGLNTQIGEGHTVDLFITGVENSLWLGEQFAQDIKTIFPFLHVKTLSSNQVLKALNHDFSRLQLGKKTIVLAITQSGQTFSTVQAINAFEQLRQQESICEVFIVTGEPSSFLGSARASDTPTRNAQPVRRDRALNHRIFVNSSGRRTAEPSTVAAAATHQTLTELLLYIAEQMQKNCPDFRPFGMTLSSDSLLILKQMKTHFLHQSMVKIIGNTATGLPIESAIHRKLIASGQKWALHVIETPLVWGIHALYTLVSVGWTIPFGYPIPIVATLFHLTLMVVGLNSHFWLAALLAPIVALSDIAIYIFGPWLWTLALRWIQGRPLLARTGNRTLVIGDTSWVHRLLKAYVSKLFSLSYGIASLEIQSANPQDQLLHRFGHQLVRGTLVFLGVPDGRWSEKQKNEENAAIMTGKQAHGVRNGRIGPEVIVLGHNPEIKHKGFNDAHILESNPQSLYHKNGGTVEQIALLEALKESRFNSFERLLASYIFFWALAKKVALFPFLKYEHWKSQSRTKIMTTASPVSGVDMKLLREQAILSQKVDAPTTDLTKEKIHNIHEEATHIQDATVFAPHITDSSSSPFKK